MSAMRSDLLPESHNHQNKENGDSTAEELYETGDFQALFSLAEDNYHIRWLAKTFPNHPERVLDLTIYAFYAALKKENAGLAARFLLLHARRAADLNSQHT